MIETEAREIDLKKKEGKEKEKKRKEAEAVGKGRKQMIVNMANVDSSRNSGQIMNKGCKKCGSISHYSKNCMCYPLYYDQPCRHCNAKGNTLYHPPDLYRFSQSRYKTPPPRSSPVSFQGTDSLSNIFSNSKN